MISITPEVAAKFPGITLGVVEGECVENKIADESAFLKEKSKAEAQARQIPVLAENPNIAAWRKMYRAFGEDPTKRKPSAEALAKRVLGEEGLPRINGIVDCYNVVSLRNLLPVGGHDAEKIAGNEVLRFAKEGEKFTPLGAQEAQETNEGEVVYADEQKILCRKWNYRDCEEAKIADHTKKFVLVVDGAMGISGEKVENAAKDLAATLEKFVVGCKTKVSFVKT
jgi:DNA/RNA-binding domain of Phe-tRNA-synthetase-like protein